MVMGSAGPYGNIQMTDVSACFHLSKPDEFPDCGGEVVRVQIFATMTIVE
jgi:hypothetical protein